MSTLQSTTTTRRRGPVPRNSLRTIASIVGWLFIVTYVTSIAAKIAFYPPLFDGDYVTGPGQDTRVLWGTVFEAVLIIANIGTCHVLVARPEATAREPCDELRGSPDHGERSSSRSASSACSRS